MPDEAEAWCKQEYFVERGDAAERILDLGNLREVDLIVLGAQPERGVPGARGCVLPRPGPLVLGLYCQCVTTVSLETQTLETTPWPILLSFMALEASRITRLTAVTLATRARDAAHKP